MISRSTDLFNDPFALGAQIQAARALVRWRRIDLAKAAGIHPNAVAYWEGMHNIPCVNRSPAG